MKLHTIQAALEHAPFDAVLLTSKQNRRYATGFPSSAGACYISKKQAVFLTDFRYIEEAKDKIQDFLLEEVRGENSYSAIVNTYLTTDGVKQIALEDSALTYAEFRRWKRQLNAQVLPMEAFIDDLRLRKTPEEVECIVRAQRIAERALDCVLPEIRPGVSEREIAARLTYFMLHFGAENMSFDPIVVSGANSSKPHGVPSDKKIEKGDFVTMDFGCIVGGYCSDMTRTVAVGHCTDEMRHVYETVLAAQNAGIAAARAGVTGKVVDDAARKMITAAGYGDAFGHGFGHGVGLDIHEAPGASPRVLGTLPAGAILTAEPGIYLPGRFGVRIEDMLYLLPEGCRNLTNAPKELLILAV